MRYAVNHNGARLFTCLFPIAYNIKIELTFQPNDRLQMAHDFIARKWVLVKRDDKIEKKKTREKNNI